MTIPDMRYCRMLDAMGYVRCAWSMRVCVMPCLHGGTRSVTSYRVLAIPMSA